MSIEQPTISAGNETRAMVYEVLQTLEPFASYLTSEQISSEHQHLVSDYADSTAVGVSIEPVWADRSDDGKDFTALCVRLLELTPEEQANFTELLVVGNDHSNEIVWTRTFTTLPRLLCKYPQLMWRLGIKGIRFLDADQNGDSLSLCGGALMNDPDTMTLKDFYEASFRSHQQPENELSARHGVYEYRSRLVGSKAIESAIDNGGFDAVHALHNASLGGIYGYMVRYPEGSSFYRDVFVDTACFVRPPIPIGVPDDVDAKLHKPDMPGLYKETTVEARIARFGVDSPMVQGNNSRTYHAATESGRRGLGVNVEVPYFISRAPADVFETSPEATQRVTDEMLPLAQLMAASIVSIVNSSPEHFMLSTDPHIAQRYRLLRDATVFLGQAWESSLVAIENDLADPEAHIWSVGHFSTILHYMAATYGQALRLGGMVGGGGGESVDDDLLTRVAQLVTEIHKPECVPARTLVAVQIASILFSALALKEERSREQV